MGIVLLARRFKMKKNINRYNSHLIPFFILIFLTVFTLWAAGKYRDDFDNTLIEQTKQNLLITSQAQAANVTFVINDIQNGLIELALNPALHQRIRASKIHKPTADEYDPLKISFENSINSSGALYLLDTQGVVLARAPFKENTIGNDYSTREGIKHVIEQARKKTINKSHAGSVYTSNIFTAQSGRNVISICLPVFTKGEFIGILRSLIYLDKFNEMFTTGKPQSSRYTWIVDTNGVIISHPQKGFIGKSINEFSVYSRNRREIPINFYRETKQQGSGFFIFDDFENKEVIMAWTPIPASNKHWTIATRIDYTEISQPSNTYAQRLNMSSAMLICIFLLLGIWHYHTKQEKKKLVMQAKSAAATSKLKSEFLTNISHEIRTPMNAIMGLTHLTLKTKLNSKQSIYLGKIFSANNNLLSLINNILDFSKIEADRLKLEKIDFSLQDIITEIEALLAFKAQEKGLLFTIEINTDSNIYVNGDPLRLKQVLINLANNAIKFTHTGSVNIDIKEIKSASEDPQIVCLAFSVRDTGIGLSANEIENLFVEFSQADTSTTRKYGGSGLGLAISKKLVNLMAGEISVSSEKGVGSCFLFTCQFNAAKLVTSPELESSSFCASNGSIINGDPIEPMFNSKKFLVVEDDEINQEIINEILISEGVEVCIANNGLEAIKYFENGENSQRFDLILMDIQMPEMDGYQATQFIRQHIGMETLPIIAMSAHTQDENIDQCIAVGMNDYIMKPYEPKAMFAIIAGNLVGLTSDL